VSNEFFQKFKKEIKEIIAFYKNNEIDENVEANKIGYNQPLNNADLIYLQTPFGSDFNESKYFFDA